MQRWETCGVNIENGGVVWLDGKRLSQGAARLDRICIHINSVYPERYKNNERSQ